MNRFVLIIAIPLLSSCSATMETNLTKSTPYAPANEIEGGVVSYLNQGANGVIQHRRNNAYKKMHDRCGGSYNIIQEGEHLEEGVATSIGNSVIYGQDRYWKIKFQCLHQ